MLRKTIYLFLTFFFITSCADTFDSVKRGLTGAKRTSGDEFLIKKKDPLILPPDYENLPTPDERGTAAEEISEFEKTLESAMQGNSSESESGTVEESIIKKIQNK
tara:strand:- start:221 stop:535 length:315 start_codon:yes stop_codon:yes gene_type:complete